jgi:hypothetical protein
MLKIEINIFSEIGKTNWSIISKTSIDICSKKTVHEIYTNVTWNVLSEKNIRVIDILKSLLIILFSSSLRTIQKFTTAK